MTSNEFQGNPESGIDRFLNESAKADEVIELPTDKVDLVAEDYDRMKADLASMTAMRNNWEEKARVAESTIQKAHSYFEDLLVGSIEPQETISEYKELMDILGFEAIRTVPVRITVSWTGSIDLPYGTEVSDLDIDDFSDLPNRIDHSEFDSYIDWEDGDIEER